MGDGMVIATPTVSTSYCMAAGGPVVLTGVPSFAIVPISCHSPIRVSLVVPEHRIPQVGARIMDLQEPERKMSTTVGTDAGRVYVLEEPDAIRKKLGSAVTDSGREILRREDKPGVTNLIDILAVARGADPAEIEREFEGAGYGDFKKAVAEGVVELLAPVRERYAELRPDEATLEKALAAGAEKARRLAAPTLADVRERMGIDGPSGALP